MVVAGFQQALDGITAGPEFHLPWPPAQDAGVSRTVSHHGPWCSVSPLALQAPGLSEM